MACRADGYLFGLETRKGMGECKTRFTKAALGLWNGVRVRVPHPIEHALVSSYGRCFFGWLLLWLAACFLCVCCAHREGRKQLEGSTSVKTKHPDVLFLHDSSLSESHACVRWSQTLEGGRESAVVVGVGVVCVCVWGGVMYDDLMGHCQWELSTTHTLRTPCHMLGHDWRVPLVQNKSKSKKEGGSDWKWDVTPFRLGQYTVAAFRLCGRRVLGPVLHRRAFDTTCMQPSPAPTSNKQPNPSQLPMSMGRQTAWHQTYFS